MEQILVQLCAYLTLSIYSMSPTVCQSTLKATYIQSGGQTIYNTGESYYSKKGDNYLHEYFNQTTLNELGDAYIANHIFQTKEIQFTTKCNMFLCDTVGFDFTSQFQSYNLGWKWSF